MVLSATRLEQGDTLVLKIAGEEAGDVPAAFLDGQKLNLFWLNGHWLAILGFDVRAATGARELLVKFSSGRATTSPIYLGERKFVTTELKLPAELVRKGITPAALRDRIASGDSKTLGAVFAVKSPTAEFSGRFGQPLGAWRDVGGFGVIRKSSGVELRHLGVDLEGDRGEEVYAANDGRVSFLGELEDFGISLVIDHGLGISTAYLHLDESMVRVGDRVLRGQIIGTVGSSGEYVLAPHLHFSVKIGGASVDPQRFMAVTNGFLK